MKTPRHITTAAIASLLLAFMSAGGIYAETIQIKLANGATNPAFQTGTLHVINDPNSTNEFDAIMRTYAAATNTIVFIHPGTYKTEGVFDARLRHLAGRF
jgi:hypothetical protein